MSEKNGKKELPQPDEGQVKNQYLNPDFTVV